MVAKLLAVLVFLVATSVLLSSEVARWEPLNIGIIRKKEMHGLSSTILDSLRSAVMQMQSFINIWHLPEDDRLSAKSLTSCVLHHYPPTGEFFMETVDLQKCHADDGLLAAATPCTLIAAARLVLCPLNHRWNSFRAITDLFRHEIMHALVGFPVGFGLIIPGDSLSSIPTTRKFFWTDESSSQRVTATYMDFQDDAVVEARKHFGCQNLHGIEADGDDKIHLSEYIYGVRFLTIIN
uniref:Leishmanolysin-like peptidase n=1 Tax=Loa loa TaxID=7209 RepID=A0A1I7VLP8_LOALO